MAICIRTLPIVFWLQLFSAFAVLRSLESRIRNASALGGVVCQAEAIVSMYPGIRGQKVSNRKRRCVEDGTIAIWNSKTYRIERFIQYGLKGIRAMSYNKTSKWFVIGFEAGLLMIQIDRELPLQSMDTNGKIIRERENLIEALNVTSCTEGMEGKTLDLKAEVLGKCELYPQILKHSPNGKCIALSGDGEYKVYYAPAWTKKSYGHALDFVWSATGDLAVRESGSRIIIMNNKTYRVKFMFGGTLLSAATSNFICFYNWSDLRLIYRVKAMNVRHVYWSSSNDLLSIATDAEFHIFKFNKDITAACVKSGMPACEDGYEGTFELLYTIKQRVRSGLWVENWFIYINSAWSLNSCFGGKITMIYHLNRSVSYLDRPMHMFGCHRDQLYLVDKNFNIVKYTVRKHLISFMEMVINGQLERAHSILLSIPKDQHSCVSHFLKSQSMLEDDNSFLSGLLEKLEVINKVDSPFKKITLRELCALRSVPMFDFEFSWKYEYLLGHYILPAVRDQGRLPNCVFQALCATAEILFMRKAALSSTNIDIKFSATKFTDDYEKIWGPIPCDLEAWKRLEKALHLFEEEGVYAEGGGAAPDRYKIAGSKYNERMGFAAVADVIRDALPVIGSFKIDQSFYKLGRDEIYEYCKEKRMKGRDGATTASHCVVFVGFGKHAGRPYLVFLNSHGTKFGEDGFGRVYYNSDMRFSTMEF